MLSYLIFNLTNWKRTKEAHRIVFSLCRACFVRTIRTINSLIQALFALFAAATMFKYSTSLFRLPTIVKAVAQMHLECELISISCGRCRRSFTFTENTKQRKIHVQYSTLNNKIEYSTTGTTFLSIVSLMKTALSYKHEYLLTVLFIKFAFALKRQKKIIEAS